MIQKCKDSNIYVRDIKAQVSPIKNTYIDLAICSDEAKMCYRLLIEAKLWIRPIDVSTWSKKNQPTSKRKKCVNDAIRLLNLKNNGICEDAALIILERNSTHLKRLLKNELINEGFKFDEQWIKINRMSNYKHKEHLGLFWFNYKFNIKDI